MRKWLVAAAAAAFLSGWSAFGLTAFAAVMARTAAQWQNLGLKPSAAQQAGMAVASLWNSHAPLLGAAVFLFWLALASAAVVLVGRISRRWAPRGSGEPGG